VHSGRSPPRAPAAVVYSLSKPGVASVAFDV
jgi:hypothetical protein